MVRWLCLIALCYLSHAALQPPASSGSRSRRPRLSPPRAEAPAAWSGPAFAPSKLTDDGFAFGSTPYERYGGSSAWWSNLLTTSSSRVLDRISGHLWFTIAVASFVVLAFEAAKLEMLPSAVSAAVLQTALPTLPHEAVGSIIGLLLAFRTSQSYDRFWEGRCIWDGVYSSTRSIVRLATAATRDAESKASPTTDAADADDLNERTMLIVGLVAAYPYALKQHLRGERNSRELLAAAKAVSGCDSRALLLRQLLLCAKQPNIPLAVLDQLTRSLLPLRGPCGDLLWWQLDAKVEELIALLGKAERIKGTPVPLSYSRHTSRFFSVYTFTLPFALAEHVALWLLPAVVGVVSWVIFATEEIGHIIEEPFGTGLGDDADRPEESSSGSGSIQLEVLPLGRYCADIASEAATIFSATITRADEMPLGDDDIDLFDSLESP